MSGLPVAEAVRQRRTVYHFRGDPLPDGLVEELLELAVQAPNHRRTQPWRFVIVRGEARERLADLRLALAEERSARDGKPVGNPESLRREIIEPEVLVYVIQRLDADEKRCREDYSACIVAAYIIQLAGWERGVGARWHTGQLAGREPRLINFLGLAENEEIACFLALGYPDEAPSSGKRAATQGRIGYIE